MLAEVSRALPRQQPAGTRSRFVLTGFIRSRFERKFPNGLKMVLPSEAEGRRPLTSEVTHTWEGESDVSGGSVKSVHEALR